MISIAGILIGMEEAMLGLLREASFLEVSPPRMRGHLVARLTQLGEFLAFGRQAQTRHAQGPRGDRFHALRRLGAHGLSEG